MLRPKSCSENNEIKLYRCNLSIIWMLGQEIQRNERNKSMKFKKMRYYT